MFGFNEKICDSFVAAIKESFQSGTPIINLIAQIDEYKDKGIVEWYAVDQGNHAITFKLASTDRRFRLGENGLAPVNAVPPENPETFNAPPHIRKSMPKVSWPMLGPAPKCKNAPACSCGEPAVKADLGKPWHNVFGELNACVDCGAILGKGKTRCRYCEDKNIPIDDLSKALKKEAVKETKIELCPVCGSALISLFGVGSTVVALCKICNVQSPHCCNKEEAVAAWNSRSRLDYTEVKINPCPICGGKATVQADYPDNTGKVNRSLVTSNIRCRREGCIIVNGVAGQSPHVGLIPRWVALTRGK